MSAASAKPVSVDGVVYANSAVYRGFTLRETAGAAAIVRIFDNPSEASGTLLDTIGLSANESAREWYGGDGIRAEKGIWFEVVAGAVEGSVRVG